MSDSDSFIEEVSEEVRRERLFILMRRYGWIAIALVVIVVGGAAYNEVRKAQITSAAQAAGDGIIAALEGEDNATRRAALTEVATSLGDSAEARHIVRLFEANEAAEDGDTAGAVAIYADISADSTLPVVYRHLADLKSTILQGGDLAAADRRATLDTLATPGAPFRLLAEEQLALLDVEAGDKDAAILRLQSILSDQAVSPGLRNRASQLIVSLGGTLGTG